MCCSYAISPMQLDHDKRETLDFSDLDKDLAAKLTDDDLYKS